MPPLTGDLPLKHPSIGMSVAILVLGYAVIGYEEQLRTAGVLAVRGGVFALLISLVGLPLWTWMMLNMVGRPDLFFEAGPSLLNEESNRKRMKLIRAIGYAFQIGTLLGLGALLMKWVGY